MCFCDAAPFERVGKTVADHFRVDTCAESCIQSGRVYNRAGDPCAKRIHGISLMKLAVLSLTLIATPATAQITVHPVAVDKCVDSAEMIGTADAIDVAAGTKDWTTAPAVATGEVWVNLTALVGGEPAPIAAAKRDHGCSWKRLNVGKPQERSRSVLGRPGHVP
ncbi:MAG: hypothetical protein AAGK71_02470 [Pseudomonadota bacterium]